MGGCSDAAALHLGAATRAIRSQVRTERYFRAAGTAGMDLQHIFQLGEDDMAHFFGTVRGSKGGTTRCGTRGSGITTHAAGWHGAIRTYVYQDEDGFDCYRVSLIPWQGSGGESRVIAQGRLDARLDEVGTEAEYLSVRGIG